MPTSSSSPVTPSRIARAKVDLTPAAERVAIEARYGAIIGPLIDAKLEAKALELLEPYRAAHFETLRTLLGDTTADRDRFLVSREKVAELLDASLSTVKRMEADGHLPEPISVGERGVRHRLVDIEAMARTRARV